MDQKGIGIMQCNERIRALREDSDFTQEEVAAMLRVAQRTYCDYESGRLRIPVDCLMTLARQYDCSIDYISGASNVRKTFPLR